MLAGRLPPPIALSPTARAVQYGVAGGVGALLAAPWLLLSAGLMAFGAFAAADPRRWGELWVCLPAGLALAGGIGWFAAQIYWVRPRAVVFAWEFDGETLRYQTPAGSFMQPVAEIRSIVGGRRRCCTPRRHWRNWRLTFRDGSWAVLPRSCGGAQARALVAELSRRLGPPAAVA